MILWDLVAGNDFLANACHRRDRCAVRTSLYRRRALDALLVCCGIFGVVGSTADSCRILSDKLARHCIDGFFTECDPAYLHRLQTCVFIMHSWAFPESCATYRRHEHLGPVAFLLSHLSGWKAISLYWNRRHVGLLSRTCDPQVQEFLLGDRTPGNTLYIRGFVELLWDRVRQAPKGKVAYGFNYNNFSLLHDIWQTGEARAVRKCNGAVVKVSCAVVHRFWEHRMHCIRNVSAEHGQKRYRAWANYPPESLFMFCSRMDQHSPQVLQREHFIIHKFHPPTQTSKSTAKRIQQRQRVCMKRSYRKRPHRRFREHGEQNLKNHLLRLNITYWLSTFVMWSGKFSPQGLDEFQAWQVTSFRDLYRMCVHMGCTAPLDLYKYPYLLAKWVGSRAGKIFVKKLSCFADAGEGLLRLWGTCRTFLCLSQRARATRRIMWWLRALRVVCTASFKFRLPRLKGMPSVSVFRRVLWGRLRRCASWTPARLDFVLHRTHAYSCKCFTFGSHFTNHIRISKSFSSQWFFNTSSRERAYYESRADCRMVRKNWDVPMPLLPSAARTEIMRQVQEWGLQFCVPWNVLRDISSDVGSVVRHSCNTSLGSKFWGYIWDMYPAASEAVVMVDHDMKTRMVRSSHGYLYELGQVFLQDPQQWHWHPQSRVHKACQDVLALYLKHVPLRFRKPSVKGWASKWLGYCYINHKAKCFSLGQFSCNRQHHHHRQVSARPSCPTKRFGHLCARGIRVLQQHDFVGCWTLWSMRDITVVAQERFSKLKFGPNPFRCSRCGRGKDMVCGGRFDIGSFFANMDSDEVLSSLQALIARVELRTGKSTVTVSKCRGGRSWLGGHVRFHAQDTEVLALYELLEFAKFEIGHRWYLLGDVLLELVRGLPTGGSLSEVLGAVFMAARTRQLAFDRHAYESSRFYVDGYTVEEVVAGLLHVDDMMQTSGLLCLPCIQGGVQELLHPLSVSLEESLPSARFLDSQWFVHGRDLRITYHNHNSAFAVGESLVQQVVRIIPFSAYVLVPKAVLFSYMQGRIARIRQLCANPRDELVAYYELTGELQNLDFPLKLICIGFACTRPMRQSRVLKVLVFRF